MVRTFVGTEVEGRLRGLRTLFVEGPTDRWFDTELVMKFPHVYLGAGRTSPSPDWLKSLGASFVSISNRPLVTMEIQPHEVVNVPAVMLHSCRVILRVDCHDALVSVPDVEVKLQGENLLRVYQPPGAVVDWNYAKDRPE